MNTHAIEPRPQRFFSLTLLCFLIIAVYSNTLWSSWHLDDIVNLVDNRNIRIQNWSFDNLKKVCNSPFVIGSRQRETIYRPIPMATFAFNWFMGKYSVVGYHLINIGIHCLISILLYFTLFNLLCSPIIIGLSDDNKHFIAILSTILWTLHPIQIQAVTYIVQRMAMLGALFYLAGLYYYIKMRNSRQAIHKVFNITACLICYMMALGSKENTITMPAAILLIEIVFFKSTALSKLVKSRLFVFFLLIISVIFFPLLFYLWLDNPLEIIIKGYRHRPFNLIERVLTESRVLMFYISQIFYPQAMRFTIMHDYPLSISLFNPINTFISTITIIISILFCFFRFQKTPLLCFAILFYFLSHSVESSIIGLELVFEHRNYLPSLFIFLPIAYGFKYLLDIYQKKSSILFTCLTSVIILLIVFLGLNTYVRNSQWKTEQTLWRDALRKAPFQARPYQNVAMYLDTKKRYHEAIELYHKALEANDPNPGLSRFISLSNIGNIYKKMSEFQNAIHYLSKAVEFESEVASAA
ncbi:MAG: tetratricopeptide repeat protein, partial [Acidobacteria bacterium]|nr:tetratricopeptide repeat protein [Acidobacteriota bacterium]